MYYQHIIVTTEDQITTITLNRADKRNAMNLQMIQELSDALKNAEEDHTVRVVLIHGKGEHFCAGADINGMKEMAEASYEDNVADAKQLANLMLQLYSLSKPTIVLAHGATVGGGLGLLAACDIAIAAKDANFGFSEVKIGITPSIISPYVIAAIGARQAQYYFLTGTRFGATEAERIGLIHQVTETNALTQTGRALAQNLLLNSPHALITAKQLIRHVADEKISPALAQHTAAHLAKIRTSKQGQEGLKAYLEKRSPIWS